MAKREHWKPDPDEHDFPAANDYLSLVIPDAQRRVAVAKLKKAPLTHRKAKDLLRASRLALLPARNAQVAKDLKKVSRGVLLSPVLLVRDDTQPGTPLIVADGYHRICASYSIDENSDIPCKLVSLSG